MEPIIKFVPYGENFGDDLVESAQVQAFFERLESALEAEGAKWSDVGLLWVANTKGATTHANQNRNDLTLLNGLGEFSASRDWYPSLIGSSAFSGFYCAPSGQHADVSDGLIAVAVLSAAFDRIPVVHAIDQAVEDRPRVGRRVLKDGLRAFIDKASSCGVDTDEASVAASSMGLLLTTGSGHIRADQAIDFKECYAIGQELLDAAEDYGANIVGGCATNRSENQFQVLYYSMQKGTRVSYWSTYNHSAVFAFLPYAQASFELAHPYERDPEIEEPLDIKFNDHDAYEEGRSFYVEEVNGKPAIDFLADHWPYSRDDLVRLADEKIAIPAEPDAHLVTIASSLSRRDKNIWPNIPVWLESIDDQLMMRMVRAEDDDAHYYLMRLRESALRENARDLMRAPDITNRRDTSVVALLCESRKYVLNSRNSNAEATEMIESAPPEGCVVGIYVNGEYSTGVRKSIGYHNYSQIGAVVRRRVRTELPVGYQQDRALVDLEIFACHASRDKHTVQLFMERLQAHLPHVMVWIDEKKIGAGDVLQDKIRAAVGRGKQLVIPFLSDRSVESPWVKRELKWAIQAEKDQTRTIVLPVVIDDRGNEVIDTIRADWPAKLVKVIDSRLYVKINDFTEAEMEQKAIKMAHDIKRMMNPPADPLVPPPDPFSNL